MNRFLQWASQGQDPGPRSSISLLCDGAVHFAHKELNHGPVSPGWELRRVKDTSPAVCLLLVATQLALDDNGSQTNNRKSIHKMKYHLQLSGSIFRALGDNNHTHLPAFAMETWMDLPRGSGRLWSVGWVSTVVMLDFFVEGPVIALLRQRLSRGSA